MITVEKILESEDFKKIHKKAQEYLKVTLPSLISQGFIEDSDYISLMFAINDLDMWFCLKDSLGTDYTVPNRQKIIVSNPLLKEMSSLQRSAIAILNTIGGSTKSRRTLNRKDLATAENNGLDDLMSQEALFDDNL